MAEAVATAKPAPAKKPAAKPEIGPVNFSADGRKRRVFTIRYWSIRNSRFLEWFYNRFSSTLVKIHPLIAKLGYDRAERPVAAVEKAVKGFMFDCRMCGQCILSSTGMSCPMNCPKQLRNGPCGGARQWQLRSDCRHALRLGQGVGRLAYHGGRRQDSRSAKAGKPGAA